MSMMRWRGDENEKMCHFHEYGVVGENLHHLQGLHNQSIPSFEAEIQEIVFPHLPTGCERNHISAWKESNEKKKTHQF